MKSVLMVVVTWTILLQSWISIANGIALDLVNPTKDRYSTFLTAVRNDVRDPTLNYGGTGIPVIGAPTTTFLRIDLGGVSLALQRKDLYVIAHLVKDNQNKYRAYFFKATITSAQLDKIFPEAKGVANQQEIKEYDESYASLERTAKATRKQAGLGISKLVSYIDQVSGKARNVQNEAKFLLVAIQMVSEAARSGYIQKAVLDNFPNGFNPDDKVIILERNWSRISEAIKGSTNGVFKTPIDLKCDGIPTTWTVKNAAELNMGLLAYLGKAVSERPTKNAADNGSAVI